MASARDPDVVKQLENAHFTPQCIKQFQDATDTIDLISALGDCPAEDQDELLRAVGVLDATRQLLDAYQVDAPWLHEPRRVELVFDLEAYYRTALRIHKLLPKMLVGEATAELVYMRGVINDIKAGADLPGED